MQPRAHTSIFTFSYSSSYSGAMNRNDPALAAAVARV